MSKSKKTNKQVVAEAYVATRNQELPEVAHALCYKQTVDFTTRFISFGYQVNHIDTNGFMAYCETLGVKRTTSERYLRKFRAKDNQIEKAWKANEYRDINGVFEFVVKKLLADVRQLSSI